MISVAAPFSHGHAIPASQADDRQGSQLDFGDLYWWANAVAAEFLGSATSKRSSRKKLGLKSYRRASTKAPGALSGTKKKPTGPAMAGPPSKDLGAALNPGSALISAMSSKSATSPVSNGISGNGLSMNGGEPSSYQRR